MSTKKGDFQRLEEKVATNFRETINNTKVKQVIYLSGISNDKRLSKHLKSRLQVEDILKSGNYSLTTLKAGIIVGAGSASFEIIRDLVEKLPVMIAPKWIKTRSQPIAISNVIEYLTKTLMNEKMFNKSFDIGGPDILTYYEMLKRYAKIRKLKRLIIILPLISSKMSSYWLYFITSVSYKLAINLVNSMKVEVVCEKNNCINEVINIKRINYDDSIRRAFDRIAQQEVFSRWTDALSGEALSEGISDLIKVPYFGCYKSSKKRIINNPEYTWKKICRIGGKTGWYYATWLWKIRGMLDVVMGGVGLNRGRKNLNRISIGDSLDFWRVIYINNDEKRLLLYAEMVLPGEAWLEFRIIDNTLTQKATFRPKGVKGRLYWHLLLPFHFFIFNGMIKKIAENNA
jgi:hypothetical protein